MPIRNPAFDIPPSHIASESRRLRAAPAPLARPVVVLAGYRSPRFPTRMMARSLAALTSASPRDFHCIAYPGASSTPAALHAVEREIARLGLPEFDVVAQSMGGVVARALLHRFPATRRIFTLASPHRGATLAERIRPDPAAHDLRAGSAFLTNLPGADSPDLICYAMLRDWMVGATNAAPQGRCPIWLDARSLAERTMSHFWIIRNPAILIDIARRLRGETPIAHTGDMPPIN